MYPKTPSDPKFPKYNNKNYAILMGFDTIEINLVLSDIMKFEGGFGWLYVDVIYIYGWLRLSVIGF